MLRRMPTTRVDLGNRSYDVQVEKGLLSEAGRAISTAGLRGKAAIISDTTVAGLHAETVRAALEEGGYSPTLHEIPAGEASKSMSHAGALCSALAEAGHDRRSFVVALGGGVVGDLA